MFGTVNKILKRILGDKAEKDIQDIQPVVDQVNKVFATLQGESADQLRGRTQTLRQKIKDRIKDQEEEIRQLKLQIETNPTMDLDAKEAIYETVDGLELKINEVIEEVLEEILPEAFAVIKETARRFKEHSPVRVSATDFDKQYATERNSVEIEGNDALWSGSWLAGGAEINWDMVHYDVQLIGGIALHRGKVAEMQTGEGKTLVSTLPVFLNALAGRGVHLVTVNNYLAIRDSEWMGPLFEFHGLTVDCVDKHTPNSTERRLAYQADVTYGTNNEFGFDYLRDNMATAPEHLVQRKHHFAIVDEVDSVLIDEARTPLIISGPTPKGDQHEFNELKPRVQLLINAQKQVATQFLADAKQKLKKEDATKEELSEGGLSLFRAYRGFPKNKAIIKFLSEEGMKQILLKTEGYYLQDNQREMHKADEELFFVIDEKNNQVELTEKGINLIGKNMDDDNFFTMPDIATSLVNIDNGPSSDEDKLKEKEEVIQDYAVKSARIHTMNQLLKSYALFEKDVDYVVMDNKVKIVDEQTGRIMDGRRYSDGLHQAIEAKENVKIEAATQTYATVTLQNYFRMYHKLAGMTGTAETEAQELWDIYELDVMIIPTNRPIAREDKQDLVYRTKREKYNAVIDDIVKLREAGRPVLVGTTTVEVSELLSKMLGIRKVDHQVLNAKMHQREAEIVAGAGKAGVVTIATNMAGRGTDIKLSTEVKDAGGLAIIGTERHDSRRVDRQLRGRAGRQGDPGSSQFYVSLEDDLMRLFGSDRIAKMMDRLGIEEGEVIQHSMITKSIERAQKKVEENNFGIRKNLLEYDDVMNSQREVIYKRRRHALFGERIKLDIANMFYELAESLVQTSQGDKDFESFQLGVLTNFGMESPFTADEFATTPADQLIQSLYQKAEQNYQRKTVQLAQTAFPVIKQVHEDDANSFKNMAVPFSDGRKTLQIVADIEKCYESHGKELIDALEKNVTLSLLDNAWKEHLRGMDDLRSNVQHARIEQKDPLLIYKFGSYDLFKSMIQSLNSDVASFLMKASLPGRAESVQQAQTPQRPSMAGLQTSKADVDNLNERSTAAQGAGRPQAAGAAQNAPRPRPQPVQPRKAEKTIGRNDPCPCGSGKKYKQCHGKEA
ncbi:MAG: preprotein translocase subunit SecA [Flavobacteriales bacterium]|nr:preprotein translocase subunit SecA [Flavobacteriales bacterium]MDG2246801.1 preprotein translocase subunit SecA [Flavobacteriales bacterium]